MEKNKGGRPPVEIDIPKLKGLLRLKPTLADTAAFFEVSERSIERFIDKNFHCTFVEFRDQNMVHTRLNLIRKAISEATKDKPNTAMLIFCLKNLCGWKDNLDPGDDDSKNNKQFILAYEVPPKAKKK